VPGVVGNPAGVVDILAGAVGSPAGAEGSPAGAEGSPAGAVGSPAGVGLPCSRRAAAERTFLSYLTPAGWIGLPSTFVVVVSSISRIPVAAESVALVWS